MADRYWVLGTGNWDAATTTNWSATSGGLGGASVPSASDNVIFDSLSNATAYTVTVTATANCLALTMSGALVGAVTFAGSSALNVAGGMTLSGTAGVTWSYSGALAFTSTSSVTLTSNGVILTCPVTVSGTGGSYLFGDDFNITGLLTHTRGTINAQNHNVTLGSFSSSNANVRTLTMGSGQWTLTSTGNITLWTTATITNLTISRSTLPVIVNGSVGAGTTRTLTQAANESFVVDFKVTTGSDGFTLGNCGSVDFTGYTGSLTASTRTCYGDLVFASGMSLLTSASPTTFAGTSKTQKITFNGKNMLFPITVNGSSLVVQFQDTAAVGGATARQIVLTSGTLDLNSQQLTHFGDFSAGTGSGTRAVAFGTNGLYINTLNTAATAWLAGGTNFSTTGTGTIRFSASTANVRTFDSGGYTYPKLEFVNATANGGLTVLGSPTFADIICSSSLQTILFANGATVTVAAWHFSGASLANKSTLNSVSGTFSLVKSGGGTVTASFLTISNSLASPAATWFAVSSVDGGGNTGWNFGGGNGKGMLLLGVGS